MVEQQVVRTARVDQIAVVVGQILEPRVRRLHEDLRVVAGRAQHALDAQHLVADGVAVTERGEHLVDRTDAHGLTAPAGTRPSTSSAAGTVRALRAKKPGSGSTAGAADAPLADNWLNTSRYLRSITGHASCRSEYA